MSNFKIHLRYAAIFSIFPSLVISIVSFLVSWFAKAKTVDVQFNIIGYNLFVFALSFVGFYVLYFILIFLYKYVKA